LEGGRTHVSVARARKSINHRPSFLQLAHVIDGRMKKHAGEATKCWQVLL
ncbi:unnamed protein product, partial [Musa acuminata var. zebrina]